MKLDFVEISGFRGFKHTTRIDLGSGFTVITGRNGVGKSTVFDAVDFVLTGSINKYEVRLAKGGGLEDHIWWIGDGAALDHYVMVGFKTASGKTMTLTRRRDGSVNSEEITALSKHLCADIALTDSWAETLVNTSLIRDERISAMSLDLTEQARFAAVRAALGASDVSAYEERAREITKAAKNARDQQMQSHAKAHEELGRSLSTLTEARSSAEQQTDAAAATETLRKRLGIANEEVSHIAAVGRDFLNRERKSIAALRTSIAALDRVEQERKALGSSNTDPVILRGRMRELEAHIEAENVQLASAQREVERAQVADEHTMLHLALLSQGEKLGLQDGRCPLCDIFQSQMDFEGAIQRLRVSLQSRDPGAAVAATGLADVTGRLDALKKELSSVSATVAIFEAERSRLDQERKRLEQELQSLVSPEIADSTTATRELIRRQEAVDEVERSLFVVSSSNSRDRVAVLEAKVQQLRSYVETEALKLNQAERALEIAQQNEKTIRQVSNELLSEQFDTVLPLLKELYRRLRPHADWREIEIDIAGKLRASMNFTVGDGYNPQFLFSSGQRRAAGLSFLLAVHLSRPWCALNTLMLDDPIQHIDDYRSLNLVEVLSAMRLRGRQIIVAVEDSALADVLCRRLRSSAEELGNRFELGVDEFGSATVRDRTIIAPFTEMVLEIAEAS